MSLSDPIADMLTRIRNASAISQSEVRVKASNVCEGIAKVLKEEGYITDYDRIDDGKQGLLRIKLKYSSVGEPVINEIKRISKPGKRVYSGFEEMPQVLGGLGLSIVTTSKGVISDRRCRSEKLGGEILCTVS
jgi:small subunit ribosomal protein S8